MPTFKYDGGSPAQFTRDFPMVAKAYGVSEAFRWPESRVLTVREDYLNTRAMVVLRRYLSERVLTV